MLHVHVCQSLYPTLMSTIECAHDIIQLAVFILECMCMHVKTLLVFNVYQGKLIFEHVIPLHGSAGRHIRMETRGIGIVRHNCRVHVMGLVGCSH